MGSQQNLRRGPKRPADEPVSLMLGSDRRPQRCPVALTGRCHFPTDAASGVATNPMNACTHADLGRPDSHLFRF
jgi:hypothetical protein